MIDRSQQTVPCIPMGEARGFAELLLTRRDCFLAELYAMTPWTALEHAVAPFYPSSGRPGRPPIGLARMLRMYVAQQCFGFSDEGIEDAIYDSQAVRRFIGVDLTRDAAPDATTLLHFRHLLERHQLTESIFNNINAHLAEKGLQLREGTLVDATLIAAPPSTKNQAGARDPDMRQSKKGNQWYFGSATCKSHGFLFHRRTDETGCSTNRSLPGHAMLATAWCEASGTTYPPIYSVRQTARRDEFC